MGEGPSRHVRVDCEDKGSYILHRAVNSRGDYVDVDIFNKTVSE